MCKFVSHNLLNYLPMRVGFIRQLHWSRYGNFWQSIVVSANSEAVFADRESVLEVVQGDRLEPIQSISFKLAVAEAIALADCDLLIVPDLNQNKDFSKGSGQDPWVANFPEALIKTIKNLPEVFAVPTNSSAFAEQRAIELLMKINPGPSAAKHILQQHLSKLTNQKLNDRVIDKPGHNKALVGQSWLLEKLSPALGPNQLLQTDIKPEVLIKEATRQDNRLIETDAEVLGAAQMFNKKASIEQITLLADKNSAGDLWLNRRLAKMIRKDFKTVFIQELPNPSSLIDYFLKD